MNANGDSGAASSSRGDDGAFVDVRRVTKTFVRSGVFQVEGRSFTAVDDVSLEIRRGEIFGLVGESGSGKTTLARVILYLDPPTRGQVLIDGQDLGTLGGRRLRIMRRRMQIVFQDPNSALDPRLTIARSLSEAFHATGVDRAEWEDRGAELLRLVGLDPAHRRRLPAQFSGGQRQRIVIARALATRPQLLILDEPVSNLDASIQAQIINLLLDLKEQLRLTYLFISHDLNLVSYMSDTIAVMKDGKIVECGSATVVVENPQHRYTRALFEASPAVGATAQERRGTDRREL